MTGRLVFAATLVFLLGALSLLGGCATYSAKFADLKPQVSQGRFEDALATVEKESGSKDRLLYYLERGMILHYAGRYLESNEAFAAADRTADELYTKSISEGVFSLLSNDNAISYRGRPYELAMVPYYKAFNYIYLGERESAQVEARRASLLLSKYIDATLQGVREEDRTDLERIRNNAFLLYFSGLIYDWDGQINDAFTAYRNAAMAYQQNHEYLGVEIPAELASDLVRTGNRLGFLSELEQVRQACPDVFATLAEDDSGRWPAGKGEMVLFLETEFVAHKTQLRFDLPIFSGEAYDDPDYWAWEMFYGMGNMHAFASGHNVEYWVSVAAPELQDQPGEIYGARVSAGVGGSKAAASSIANLSREARVTFDAEKPTIFFKTIARGLTKYLASRGAEKAGGDVGKIAALLFGAVTESADTRSWLTLPEKVNLARLSLVPGVYDLEVELLDIQGRPIERFTIPGVEVRAGEFTFLNQRSF